MKDTTMKKTIRIIGFLLGLIILTGVLSLFFKEQDGLKVYDSLSVHVKTADIKAEPDQSLQILFYGDSECYASFSPNDLYSEFGYTSYGCGTAAQKICDTYAILNENLKTQSPDIIVLETNCLFRSLKEKEGTPDPVMDLLTDRVPVIAYHSRWKELARKSLPKKREENRRKNKGFVVREGVNPYNGTTKYMNKTDKAKKIDEDILEYLDQIKALCDKNDITLLLVSAPAPKNWNYEKHNGVADWASSHEVDYMDLNLEDGIKINWKKDSKDGGDHLNLKGARKVTKFMGEYFRDTYGLTAEE